MKIHYKLNIVVIRRDNAMHDILLDNPHRLKKPGFFQMCYVPRREIFFLRNSIQSIESAK